MYLKSLLILLFCITIIGCPWKITIPPETTGEKWIAIVDIDGSNFEYICKSGGSTPYFVPDLDNLGEELILLNYSNRIDLMKLDGTERRTIIDSVGSVFSFSQDKTKMLLNCNGEIYISNVDGSGLQNLTNSPDIYELHPTFSADAEKIVFCYRLTHEQAFLAIRDLDTNQDNIVFDFQVEDSTQTIAFWYPAFQNDNRIIYNFKLEDQEQVPYTYSYELHRISLDENTDEILFDASRVYYSLYDNNYDICFIYTDSGALIFDVNSLQIIHEFTDTSIHDVIRFSSNSHYLTIGNLIYNFINNSEYFVDIEDNDFNLNETEIVGVKFRSFPED